MKVAFFWLSHPRNHQPVFLFCFFANIMHIYSFSVFGKRNWSSLSWIHQSRVISNLKFHKIMKHSWDRGLYLTAESHLWKLYFCGFLDNNRWSFSLRNRKHCPEYFNLNRVLTYPTNFVTITMTFDLKSNIIYVSHHL